MSKVMSIHYLRGLAALAVVAFHLRPALDNIYAQKNLGQMLFSNGNAGVDLFFIISGFIITLSTAKENASPKSEFLIKRFFRIYPVLILCLAGMFLITKNTNIYEFIKSAIPLHRDYSSEAPYFGYNPLSPAWTLTFEIYFYIIFFVSLSISHKYRSLICSILLVLIVLSTQLYFNGHFDFSGNSAAIITEQNPFMSFLRFSSSPMVLEFVIGMILYEIRNVFKHIPHPNIIAFALLSFAICAYCSGFRSGHGPLNYGLWSLSALLSALLYEANNDIKFNRIFSFLGDISYSLYMVHVLVITLFIKHLQTFSIYAQTSGFSRFIFFISLSIITSYVMYMLIEKPSIKAGRILLSKIHQQTNNFEFKGNES